MFDSVPDIDDSIFTLEYADSVSLLSKAARVGDLKKIKKLISKGSLPQTPDNRGWTSIHVCVDSNQIEALRLILKLKPNNKKYLVNLKTWENITPLLIAVKKSQPSLQMVKLLLNSKADPNECTHTKLSPLHVACLKKGTIDIVKLLVQFGADVNVQEDLSLNTPLHFAVSKGCDLKVIEFLHSLSDLNLKNVNERTAFLESCNFNQTEIVRLFLEKDKNLSNSDSGLPPLVYAGLHGNLEMVHSLIESGADVNAKCKAIVSCDSEDSDLILFDRENFLPIHSSLKNIQVFTLLLKLTESDKLLQLETNYYNFSLFVLICGSEVLYEKILHSNLPNELKTFDSDILVRFILSFPVLEEFICDKFHLVMKYNFNLTPDDVFNSFSAQFSNSFQISNLQYLYLLAKMGISNCQRKNFVIDFLQLLMTENNKINVISLIKSILNLLSVNVLTLKQLCRIAVRSLFKTKINNNELFAFEVIKNYNLPDSIKKFLLFESIN